MSSCVRIVHRESGAVGEARDERSQAQNKKLALRRLAESPKFIRWARAKAWAIEEGHRSLEAKVDAMMAKEEDFAVEYLGGEE